MTGILDMFGLVDILDGRWLFTEMMIIWFVDICHRRIFSIDSG
jgi:hypothetical protein